MGSSGVVRLSVVLAKRVAYLIGRSSFFQRLVRLLWSVSSLSFAAANLDSLAASDSSSLSSARFWLFLVRLVTTGRSCCKNFLCMLVLQLIAVVSVAGLLGVCRFCIVS